MTAERWKRLSELFESAVTLAPDQRASFLASQCPDDPGLGDEVRLLLESHEHAGAFGEAPAFQFTELRPQGSLALGVCLGRYEISGFVAAGGMGEVYRARDPRLGRAVGIKVLPRPGAISPDQLARFEREARAVGALNHPNVLAVHDVGVERGIPYVVFELLDGETLRARLDRGPLRRDDAVTIARQIVSGLAAAHDKGIVHRDLKPENLFIAADGLVKILDFGLATQSGTASLTEHGLVIGTAGYMSPEQVRGEPADERSDVFAFGAVLYEMVTGARAFAGDSAAERMTAVLTTHPPLGSLDDADVPSTLASIVRRSLEKSPRRRFASMREIATAFNAVSLSTPPVLPPAAGERIVLAVLPFANLSDDASQEYFSDGLTDEMIAQLGRLNPTRLGVIARTSAMRYKRTAKGIDAIGRGARCLRG
jgi:serine/threonine protein kinase